MDHKRLRQRRLGEMPSDFCKGCVFLADFSCTVPGGTCVYRSIDGVPGQFVGDILANVGTIGPEWEEKAGLNS